MKVELLAPDAPAALPPHSEASAFARALQGVADTLAGAESAEDSYARGAGSLQAAVYERARADVALSVASAAASRAVSALQTITNMQV